MDSLEKKSNIAKKKIDTTRLANGQKVGQYIILNEIDRGGMAVVYRAQQLGLDRYVALKVLPPSIALQPKFIERFEKEARSIAQMDHKNIVRIIEVGDDNGIYFIAMEYIDGLSLFQFLKQTNPSVFAVLNIIAKLAVAIEYAHERNIIHRDLKLNNVIMSGNANPILIDFGLAKAITNNDNSSLTVSGEVLGSPAYMSPEQASGKRIDERTDIYSLGIMFYELLTKRNPFLDKRGHQQTMMNVVRGEVVPLKVLIDWVPKDVESIALKALEKDLTKRYQTMKAFRMDIERYLAGEPVKARPISRISKIRKFINNKKWIFLTVTIVTTMLTAFYFYYSFQKKLEKSGWEQIKIESNLYNNLDESWAAYTDYGKVNFLNIMESPWVSGGSSSSNLKTLQVQSFSKTWIINKEKIEGDMALEFSLISIQPFWQNFSFFICASNPEDGYTAFFTQEDILLTKGSSRSVVARSPHFDLKKDKKTLFRIEKNGNIINLFVDDNLVISYKDYNTNTDKGKDHFGFYLESGSFLIQNIEVYKLLWARKLQPIEVAENFYSSGYYKDAITKYRDIIINYPDTDMASKARYKIGLSFMKLSEYDLAITEFKLLIEGETKDIKPYGLERIIESYRKLNDQTKELEYTKILRKKYLESSSFISVLFYNNNLILDYILAGDKKSIKKAIKRLDFLKTNFIESGEFYIDSYLALGDYYFVRNKISSAEKIFSSINDDFPKKIKKRILAQISLGNLKSYIGNYRSAIHIYNKIISIKDIDASKLALSWFKLGEVYRCTGNSRDALKSYNNVIESYSLYRDIASQAMIGKAMIYHEQKAGSETSKKIFQLVIESYRDQNVPYSIASFMNNTMSEKEFLRVSMNDDAFYYIAEKARVDGKRAKAVANYFKFLKICSGNKLLEKLTRRQMSLLK